MLNRAHVKIKYQQLVSVFRLGSDRYAKLGGLLGTIMNRNNRDEGMTRRMAFRNKSDISRNPPIHSLRNDPGWSERVEITIKPNRLSKSVNFDVRIIGPTRMLATQDMPRNKDAGESTSPFIGVKFTRNADAQSATVTGLTLQGKDLPVTPENFNRLMALAAMTTDQILSGSPVSFAGNIQRIYGKHNRKKLRHLMTTGRAAPTAPKGPA